MDEKEYKTEFGFAHGRGVITPEDSAHMRVLALENNMDEQLKKAGKQTRFKPDDPRTKTNSNPWGGRGAPRP